MEMQWPFGTTGAVANGEIQLDWRGADGSGFWVFRNDFGGLRNDPVIFPDGSGGKYLSYHLPTDRRVGGVVCLPVIGTRLVLMRTFRHATRRWEIEAPRGFIDAGEDSDSAALRELQEEYGVSATRFERLGQLSVDSALVANDTACFWCEIDAVPSQVGEHVKSDPFVVPITEAFAMIARGEIRDGFTAFCMAAAIGRGLISL